VSNRLRTATLALAVSIPLALVSPGVASATDTYYPKEKIGNEGCTPGYWKNHHEDWVRFTTGQSLESVFDVPDGLGLDDVSLANALSFTGGSGTGGAAQILLRAAVAALQNAAHGDVDYAMRSGAIINQVNKALASGNRATMLNLANRLDQKNNAGCPL
jgi:hypothetical protein